MATPSPARLDGWKAIAEYLGRDARTLQRWRDERGLPIHRVPGAKGGTVFAYPSELEAWLRQAPQVKDGETSPAANAKPVSGPATEQPPPIAAPIQSPSTAAPNWRVSPRQMAGFAVVVALIGVVTARWVNSNPPPPAPIERVDVRIHSLVALDAGGREIWTFAPPSLAGQGPQTGMEPGGTQAFPVDLDADGLREVLAFVRFQPKPGLELGETYALSPDGSMLWRFAPDLSLQFDSTRFRGPWRLRRWIPPSAGEPVWMSFIHQTWWPSFVLTVNRSGQPTLRFVNSGHIEALGRVKTRQGTLVFAGGTNNEYGAASLAVLPENGAPSTSPHENSLWRSCDLCPSGAPARYFLFWRSDVNIAQGSERNYVNTFTSYDDGSLDVSVRERYVPYLRAVYHFSPDLRPESVAMSDAYWDEHARMSNAGIISHSVEECPLRRHGVTVRSWDAANGWSDVAVPYAFITPQKHD
jgi:hypothetical protein